MINIILKKLLIFGLICLFLGSIVTPSITAKGTTINKISPKMNNEKVETVHTFGNDVEFFGVFFGVAKFQDYFYDSGYADYDAKNMYELLKSKKNWKEENMKLYLNEEVTIANIVNSIDWLANESDENDVIVFFYAGHGLNFGERRFRFTPAKHGKLTDYLFDKISDIELSKELDKCKSDHIVIILDCCWSAGMTALIKPGRILIAAGGKIFFCYADWDPNVESGIFSHYLHLGLEGSADVKGNNDGIVSAEEIFYYAHKPTMIHSFLYHADVHSLRELYLFFAFFPGIQNPWLYDKIPGETPLVYL